MRVILALALIVAAKFGLGVWQRRQVLRTFRRAWGSIGTATSSDLDAVAEAWRELDAEVETGRGIDPGTWQDLDLDAVLSEIDRTRIGLGRQQLYRRVRNGAGWHDAPFLDRLVQHLMSEASTREAVAVTLGGVSPALGFGFWRITDPTAIVTRWWYWAFPLLTTATVAALLALIVYPRALIVLFGLLLCNLVVRMVIAWQLPALLVPIRQVAPVIDLASRLARIIGGAGFDVAPIQAEVAALRSLRGLCRWASRDPVASGELLSGVGEYLNLLLIVDANVLFFGARRLRRAAPVLRDLALWVGDVDLALGVARLRAEPRDWCSATTPADHVATGLWHPLVRTPVPNDLAVTPGEGLIVTGANMAGKSTYLRTVGVAAVLVRAIDTCPAIHWGLPTLAVRSLIGRADNLRAGKSYYQVEADRAVALLRQSQGPVPTLFLLDELLRGTNTIERLAAGEAILRALLDAGEGPARHVVLVATHDGELVGMVADRYRAWHFRETITPEGLDFDYRRRPGPATTRTAIALLEASGAPPQVVDAARRRATALDRGTPEP
jgi:hypothetical protein